MVHIKHNLTINTSPETVYRALTTENGIRGWWTADTKIKPEAGSIAEFNFGERYHNEMKIMDLQPNRRVEWYVLEADAEWIGTTITFNLEEKEEKTLLRFGHINWEQPTDFYANCNYQWGRYLRSLKDFCETGKGTPFKSESA